MVVDSKSADLILHTPLLHVEPQKDDTVAHAVDYKHRPAIRSKHGRWISSSFIIWVEMAERLAYYGVQGNLINFLTGRLGQSTAMAAANVNAWSGVSALLPILGAVIADSFLGKFSTIIASSIIYILGLGLLTLSAVLPSLSCVNQGSSPSCLPTLQITVFFIALYLVAFGKGGHKPCVQAFGADQFDGEDPVESKEKSSFFNWWNFGTSFGYTLGIGVLSYVDNLSWGLGFGIPCIIMVVSIVIFLLGTKTYRFNITSSEGESPFKRIGRVFVLSTRNWNAILPKTGDKNEFTETQTCDGCQQFRFLDKALFGPEICGEACSKNEVEEAKAVLRLFPIWATSLVFGIVFSQPPTLFTKQGVTLDRSIGSNFVIPAAALQCVIGICVVIFLPIYDCFLVPVARRLTGRPSGISMIQRIGCGLFISIFCMGIAAITEKKRLETATRHGLVDMPNVTIPMHIWWLLPQYVLFGISEAFTIVGLQEFFYDQVPNELRSVGISLYLSIFGLGGLLSSSLVSLIDQATRRDGGESWFSNNLNRAHLDYFYWLLTGLNALGLAFFVYFGKSYIYNRNKARLR